MAENYLYVQNTHTIWLRAEKSDDELVMPLIYGLNRHCSAWEAASRYDGSDVQPPALPPEGAISLARKGGGPSPG